MAQLPGNIPQDPSHWHCRLYPDGSYRTFTGDFVDVSHPEHPSSGTRVPNHLRGSPFSRATMMANLTGELPNVSSSLVPDTLSNGMTSSRTQVHFRSHTPRRPHPTHPFASGPPPGL